MSPSHVAQRLGSRLALILRAGTLLAVGLIALGFGMAWVRADPPPGPRPVHELILAGGGDAFVAGGLVALTLLPLAVLALAAATFARDGERRYTASSLVTIGLLAASLVTAALVAAPG